MATDAKQSSSVLQRVLFCFQNQFNGMNTQMKFERARGSRLSIYPIDDFSLVAYKFNGKRRRIRKRKIQMTESGIHEIWGKEIQHFAVAIRMQTN